MVVGEGGADGFADFEASVFGDELDFGRGEGVVVRKLDYAVVESLEKIFLQPEEAEMEVEGVCAGDEGLRVRLLLQRLLFLLQP